jgi:hypothetical protein
MKYELREARKEVETLQKKLVARLNEVKQMGEAMEQD